VTETFFSGGGSNKRGQRNLDTGLSVPELQPGLENNGIVRQHGEEKKSNLEVIT
jgi:hypothetical protein